MHLNRSPSLWTWLAGWFAFILQSVLDILPASWVYQLSCLIDHLQATIQASVLVALPAQGGGRPQPRSLLDSPNEIKEPAVDKELDTREHIYAESRPVTMYTNAISTRQSRRISGKRVQPALPASVCGNERMSLNGKYRPHNLNWCQWPVCSAFRLTGKCPLGEDSCRKAHVLSEQVDTIDEKGCVPVCFDALGINGRVCRRLPGRCRFFHVPTHIRQKLLKRRYFSWCQVSSPCNDTTTGSKATGLSDTSPVLEPDPSAVFSLRTAATAAVIAQLVDRHIRNPSKEVESLISAVLGLSHDEWHENDTQSGAAWQLPTQGQSFSSSSARRGRN